MKAIVADDDRISRAVLKRLLSHINVEVVEADNGLTALNLIEQVDPDFIVMDLKMPVLSGLEALGAIRQSPTRRDLPVICVSATSTSEQVAGMMGLGVADYLVKPINPVEALPRIKEVMLRSANWRQRSRDGVINTLMLVDADPNVLAFVRPLLEHDFGIVEATSSTDGALRFRSGVQLLSLEELILRHALGEAVNNVARESCASGVMMIPIPREGFYEGVENVEAAQRIAGVERVEITAKLRQKLVPLPEGASYLGFIFARGADPQTVGDALRESHARLKFLISQAIPVM